jgi:Fe-S cluster assembly protein SufD
MGAAIARTDIDVHLEGEGAEATLNGLSIGGGKQLIDNHTKIEHTMPHCPSHELYKGIWDDESEGVFNGRIHVHQDAQKTDAKQTNQHLILSRNATINTKPELEIYADDVRCTHGATIGQLSEDALFYLQARGIGVDEARSLLTYAFASDILERIKVEALRDSLEERLVSLRGVGGDIHEIRPEQSLE